MSHIIPVIFIAFLIWQWLNKGKRQDARTRSDAIDTASPWSASERDETNFGGNLLDVGDVVADLFGSKGQEALARTVARALDNPEIERKLEEVLEPVMAPAIARVERKKKQKQAAQQRRAERAPRTRYLLDGEDGHRQKIDRIALLQKSMRGKGLCSPR